MSSSKNPDVTVVGDGIIGLCIARALARSNHAVQLVGQRRAGIASTAAAGLLAPTIDPAPPPAFQFAVAARERYRSFVAELRDETSIDTPLHFDGILRVPFDESLADQLHREAGESARWLSPAEARELEPSLDAPHGALFHDAEGTVDNDILLDALARSLATLHIDRIDARVVSLHISRDRPNASLRLQLSDGSSKSAETVVLAPGAWLTQIEGLPRQLPITPIRGQMLALRGTLVTRPVFGSTGYLAPRAERGYTVAGSTAESVGFDVGTTQEALDAFAAAAQRMVPTLGLEPTTSWSGLRPMTPDLLPFIGPDPDFPSLIYACGHSKNGILMGPITGDVIANLCGGGANGYDLSPFRISRFSEK